MLPATVTVKGKAITGVPLLHPSSCSSLHIFDKLPSQTVSAFQKLNLQGIRLTTLFQLLQ